MAIRKSLVFLLRAVTTGLALAFLYILIVQPDLLRGSGTIVEVRESPTPAAPPVNSGLSGPVSYADAVGRAMPAVVNVQTAKVITRRTHPLLDDPLFQHFFGKRFSSSKKEIQTSLGSGVIISSQGYILTNNHVISGADDIQVLLSDGRSARAAVVGVDAETDLAILRIALDRLPTIVIGDSSALRVGDIAMAIGNPFGVGQTVTLGIISATGRDHLGINTYEDFIQTDAAINPGNSGGALVNARGQLIGINTAIFSQSGGYQGIGFAVPSVLARRIAADLQQFGEVRRGSVGYVEVTPLSPQLAQQLGAPDTKGVLIQRMRRDSSAYRGGLRPGDIVVSFNRTEIADGGQLLRLIQDAPIGSTAVVAVLRDGRRLELKVPIERTN
jgi:serine protease DegS